MKIRSLLAMLSIGVVLAGCSFQNKYEREADKITKAVIADNLDSVKSDIAPGTTIPRIRLAAWSDELNDQGKLESIKEVTPCDRAGYHCFDVKFEKHMYSEWLLMNDQNKVVDWKFHIKNAG